MSTMQFKRFDPGARRLPAPKISVLPSLGRRSWAWRGARPRADGLQRGPYRYTRSRYALTDAYRLCGVGQDGALLAPAYHCRTMLDPALRLGAECQLYPLQPDLSVDVAVVDRLLAQAGRRIAVVLATHFFGFTQDFRALAACCARHGVHLVEDCSHLLPALGDSSALGSVGRYAVWSPYKFYSCEDGGYLQINGGAPVPEHGLVRQSGWAETKGLVRLLRRPRKTVSAADLAAVADQIAARLAGPADDGLDLDESSDRPSGDYLAAEERRRMSSVSDWLIRHADVERIKQRRRQRYLQWLEAAAGWRLGRPLHAELPQDCVPYMFPLYVERPQTQFLPLKRIGVPIWRWDSAAVSSCPVAQDYRLHVFHLPCHQELDDAEMRWMTEAVSAVM